VGRKIRRLWNLIIGVFWERGNYGKKFGKTSRKTILQVYILIVIFAALPDTGTPDFIDPPILPGSAAPKL
jgi:hypothetical protein